MKKVQPSNNSRVHTYGPVQGSIQPFTVPLVNTSSKNTIRIKNMAKFFTTVAASAAMDQDNQSYTVIVVQCKSYKNYHDCFCMKILTSV